MVIAARKLDHRHTLHDFGIRFDRRWWLALAGGFALGAFLMTLVFALEAAAGWIRVTVTGLSLSLALTFSVVKVLCVGTYEELISRGYQLRNLAESIGLPAAVLISSLIFAALHATTENATPISIAALAVNGAMFAAAAIVTGRLSAAIGLHIAWNFFEGSVYGFPVSGDKEGASIAAMQQLGSTLLTGGNYGPEGGLIGVAASLAGIAVILLSARVRKERGREREAPAPS